MVCREGGVSVRPTLATLINFSSNDISAHKIGGRRTNHRGEAWQAELLLFLSSFDHSLMEKPRTGGRRGASPVPLGEPVTAGKDRHRALPKCPSIKIKPRYYRHGSATDLPLG